MCLKTVYPVQGFPPGGLNGSGFHELYSVFFRISILMILRLYVTIEAETFFSISDNKNLE